MGLPKQKSSQRYPLRLNFFRLRRCHSGAQVLSFKLHLENTRIKDVEMTQEGGFLRVEKLPGKVGDEITFDKVLMYADGENVDIGRPLLQDVTVKGHIIEQGKHRKIIVFKYKKRKRYRKKQGHRQQYTAIRIDHIGLQAAKTAETAEV